MRPPVWNLSYKYPPLLKCSKLHRLMRLKKYRTVVQNFCSQGSVPWTVGETRRSEGTKIMAGADRRGLPAAVSVENATPHEVKLVVPVLKARRRFRLKRIEELMDRSLTEVRLRLGPQRAQVSSRRGYSSGARQFWRGALFYGTRRTSLSQRGQRGAVEEPIDNFRPRTGQGLSYA